MNRATISNSTGFSFEALIKRFCRWSEKNGNTREIWRNENGNNVLYLKRHYIYRCKYFEIMIHQFYRGDTGDLHNHPTYSFGRILIGGYYEWLCDQLVYGYSPIGLRAVWRQAGFFQWTSRPASDKKHINAQSYHKVQLPAYAIGKGIIYTLFIMGKRNSNRWSFWQNGNPIDFEEKFSQDGTLNLHSSPEKWGMGWFPKKLS